MKEKTNIMEIEAKKIDQLAKQQIKKTCYNSEENLHMFTIGFKMAYRHFTGNTVKYNCTKKCKKESCACSLPEFKMITIPD